MHKKALLEGFYNVPDKLVIKMPEYAPDKYKNSLLVKDDFITLGVVFLSTFIISWIIYKKCIFCNYPSFLFFTAITTIPLIISRIYTHSIPKVFEVQIDANGITINQNQFYSWRDIENEKTHSIGIFAFLDYSMDDRYSPVEAGAYKISFRNKHTKEKIEFLVKANFNEENYSSQQEIANKKPKESILSKLFYSILTFRVRTERIPILECRNSVANLLINYRKIFEILEDENKNL